jgi:hypothetical protein
MVTPRRRSPFGVFNRAALAPLRMRAREREPLDLPLTAHRRYGLERLDRMRWYPRDLGWRMEGAGCNALVRDFVAAHWVTETVSDTGRHTLEITDRGRNILAEGAKK